MQKSKRTSGSWDSTNSGWWPNWLPTLLGKDGKKAESFQKSFINIQNGMLSLCEGIFDGENWGSLISNLSKTNKDFAAFHKACVARQCWRDAFLSFVKGPFASYNDFCHGCSNSKVWSGCWNQMFDWNKQWMNGADASAVSGKTVESCCNYRDHLKRLWSGWNGWGDWNEKAGWPWPKSQQSAANATKKVAVKKAASKKVAVKKVAVKKKTAAKKSATGIKKVSTRKSASANSTDSSHKGGVSGGVGNSTFRN